MWETILIGFLLSIFTTAGSYLTHAVASFFKSKTKSEKLRTVIDIIDKIVINAVKTTEQTAKQNLKEAGGKLSSESAKKLFEDTFEEVRVQIPKDAEKEIEKLLPNLDGYIKHKIESTVLDLKQKL